MGINDGGASDDFTVLYCDCNCSQKMAVEYDDRVVIHAVHHAKRHTLTLKKPVGAKLSAMTLTFSDPVKMPEEWGRTV